MLYELIAVVRPGNHQEVKEIARTAGTLILRSAGIVRGFTNWGVFRLPRTVVKHQSRYRTGHYFIMRFDSSAAAQENIRRTLGLDPRMVRFGVVKLGVGGLARTDKGLEGMKDVEGAVDWGRKPMDSLRSSFEGRR